ncbi:MAG: mitochondrial fission ELM1 family protein [Pseudoxanthomonas sp.]
MEHSDNPERIVLINETTPPTASRWLLSDGHAGNVRQVDALAFALGNATDKHWTLESRRPWRWAAPRVLPAAHRAFGAEFATALSQPPALAIGCGRQAALATRLLRSRGARTVQILDPRLDARHWDLVIAPEHDGLEGEHVIQMIGSLHPVEARWLAAGRAAFPMLGLLPGPRTTLLVGGPSAHVALDAASVLPWLSSLVREVAQQGGSLLVTSSRRTPAAVSALLREQIRSVPHYVWHDGDPNPYAGLLGWADRIVCTPDSVNMLSEASATDVPVEVIAPEQVKGRPARFLQRLLSLARIRRYAPAQGPWHVTPLRETARVAELVRQRLELPERT